MRKQELRGRNVKYFVAVVVVVVVGSMGCCCCSHGLLLLLLLSLSGGHDLYRNKKAFKKSVNYVD